MTASRSHRPNDDPFRTTRIATTAVHGGRLPLRLRLSALVIALVIAVTSAAIGQPAIDDAEHGSPDRIPGIGRHHRPIPVIDDAD